MIQVSRLGKARIVANMESTALVGNAVCEGRC
jgi:hypothetical protein